MLRHLLAPLAVLIALSVAQAARADDTNPRLDRLFELMRLEEVLVGFPEALVEGMEENRDAWSGDMSRDAVERAARRHFGAPVLSRDLRVLMAGALSPEELDASLAFYDSDLGHKIVQQEVDAADPAIAATVEAEGARIYRELAGSDDPRADRIRRMMEAMSLVDWGMAMVMNMGFAMFSAVYAGPETEGGLSEDQILAMINASMGDMRDELTTVLNGELAYTYRRLSDAEFERYVAFLESPAGLALSRASLDAVRTSMIERARAFGHDLRVLMRQRRS